MTTIHMQTETVHATARQMRQSGEQAMLALQSLGRAVQALQATWQGRSSEEFEMETQDILRRLNTQIDVLLELAGRVDREVTEWEEADRIGIAALDASKLPWVSIMPISLVPIAAGAATKPFWGSSVLPILSSFSIGQFITNVPKWLDSFLDNFFKTPEIISPIAEGQPTTVPTPPRTTFGDLIKEQPEATPSAERPAPPPSESPASKYDSYHDVPIKSQDSLMKDRGCVPTSASMIMDYYHAQDADHKTATPQDLVNMLDPGDETSKGMSATNLSDELNDLGYQNISAKVDANFDDLGSALKDGPVIVTTGVGLVGPGTVKPDVPRAITGPGNGGHAMVVTGISAENVVVNDPWSGKQLEFSRDTFGKMWSNGKNGLYIIRP